MQEFEIIFYETADGTEPAKNFIVGLDTKMRAKMVRTIEMLQKNGNRLREPESKPLEDGIIKKREQTLIRERAIAGRGGVLVGISLR